MLAQMHFAAAAVGLLLAIAGLLWVMACAITARKMEGEGIAGWKVFVSCLLLTPLAGLIVVGLTRSMRPNRPLAQTVTRG